MDRPTWLICIPAEFRSNDLFSDMAERQRHKKGEPKRWPRKRAPEGALANLKGNHVKEGPLADASLTHEMLANTSRRKRAPEGALAKTTGNGVTNDSLEIAAIACIMLASAKLGVKRHAMVVLVFGQCWCKSSMSLFGG